jgi:hypothetical protein
MGQDEAGWEDDDHDADCVVTGEGLEKGMGCPYEWKITTQAAGRNRSPVNDEICLPGWIDIARPLPVSTQAPYFRFNAEDTDNSKRIIRLTPLRY